MCLLPGDPVNMFVPGAEDYRQYLDTYVFQPYSAQAERQTDDVTDEMVDFWVGQTTSIVQISSNLKGTLSYLRRGIDSGREITGWGIQTRSTLMRGGDPSFNIRTEHIGNGLEEGLFMGLFVYRNEAP